MFVKQVELSLHPLLQLSLLQWLEKDDAKLLAENGGPLSITTNWAKSLYITCSLLKEEVALIRKY